MKCHGIVVIACLAALCAMSCGDFAIGTRLGERQGARIIDHLDANVAGIAAGRIADAKGKLVVAYWHTSHGSQLVTGIDGMDEFYAARGWAAGTFTLNGEGGLAIDEQDPDVGAFDSSDVAHSAELFQQAVRAYLADHPTTNVVMASWCGQVGYDTTTEAGIDSYLARIAELEAEHPGVAFVYMTGHSDGGGLEGKVHRFDQRIRDYCEDHDKWLYDFYDIECYDPDGQYFGDKHVDDACNYDGGNWALEWQNAHAGQWWACSAAHSQPLNGNQKAKAAWQLWCAIADGM
jgi:hypothetical protein